MAPSGEGSGTRESEFEGHHFFAVAHQKQVPDQDRVIPGLALNGRDLGKFLEAVRSCRDQHEVALLGEHQHQVLRCEEEELTVTVASALPLSLAVGQVDAGHDAVVEPVDVPFVDDEVV